MMDIEKFNALANLVLDAKIKDKEALDKMNQATSDWKAANYILTDRMKVFDEYVASQKSEAISL